MNFLINFGGTGQEKLSSQIEDITRKLGGMGVPVSLLEKALASLSQWGSKLAGLGAITLLGWTFKRAADHAAELVRHARELETTIERADNLKNLADVMGIAQGEVTGAVQFLRTSISQALSGSEEAVRHFERIGLSVRDLENMDPAQLFMEISKRVGDGRINAVNFADAVAVLGRGSRSLLSAMKDDFGDVAKKVEGLNHQLGPAQIAALREVGQAWRLWRVSAVEQIEYVGARMALAMVTLSQLMAAVSVNAAGRLTGNGVMQDTAVELLVQRQLTNDPDWNRSEAIRIELEARLGRRQAARAERETQAAALAARNRETGRQIAFDELSAEEQINDVHQRRLELAQQIAAARNPVLREELRASELALNAQENALRRARRPDERPTDPFGNAGDALSRIGLYIGRSDPNRQIFQRQLERMDRIVSELERIHGTLREGDIL